MKVKLYISSSEKNRLDKRNYLLEIAVLEGTLRDASSLVNPIVTFEMHELLTTLKVVSDSQEFVKDDLNRDVVFQVLWKDFVSKTNYAYIDAFGRYYYITDIIALTNELFEIHFASDVLMTFKDQILPLYGFVTRSDNLGDRWIEDSNRVFYYGKVVTIQDEESLVFESEELGINAENWVLTTIVQASSLTWTKPTWPTSESSDAGLPDVWPANFASRDAECCYIASYDEISNVIERLLTTQSSLSEFVKSIVALPFNPEKQNNTRYTVFFKDQTMSFDWGGYGSDRTYQTYYTKGPWSGYLKEAEVNIDAGNSRNFLNNTPYCRCEMYLPFYGWIELNLAEVNGHTLSVYYNVSFEDGSGMVYVYDTNSFTLIFSAPCQIGVKASYSVSSQQQNTAQKNANALNMGIGLVSSAITAGYGIGTGNAVAITNGVMGGVRTVTGVINSNMTMFEKASSTFASGEHALFSIRHVQLRYTRMEPATSDDVINDYKEQFGLPCNKVLRLSALRGFARVGQIHLDGISGAFSGEMDDIETLLANGVYF